MARAAVVAAGSFIKKHDDDGREEHPTEKYEEADHDVSLESASAQPIRPIQITNPSVATAGEKLRSATNCPNTIPPMAMLAPSSSFSATISRC